MSLSSIAALLATFPAAAAGDGADSTLLAVIVLGAALAWLASLLLHPFTACATCKGAPRRFGSVATKSFRLCRTCGGSGRRLRTGARVWARNRS